MAGHLTKYLTTLLFVIFALSVRAQSLLPESPQSVSFSHANIAGRSYSFALNPSQSGADSIKSLRAAIAYAPYIGGLQDANQSSAEGSWYSSFTDLSFTAGITTLSYEDIFSDLAVSAAITKTFILTNERKASAGIRLRYESLGSTANNPKLHFFIADLGFTIGLTQEFSIGAAALNILGAKYEITSGEIERLDRRFFAGIGYHPKAIPLEIFTSVEENWQMPLAFQFGAAYDLLSYLVLRIGTSTDTGNLTTGIGLQYANFSFDASSRFDKALGSIFTFGASGAW
jgi:hypothetical protein